MYIHGNVAGDADSVIMVTAPGILMCKSMTSTSRLLYTQQVITQHAGPTSYMIPQRCVVVGSSSPGYIMLSSVCKYKCSV